MERFAERQPDRIVKVLETSPKMENHGAALDAVREARDDGQLFCFLDPDILARGPFLVTFAEALDGGCAAVTSGQVLLSRPDCDYAPLLQDAIDTLGPWSRFGADPRFGPDAARRMFRAWVERAVREDERMLSISEDGTGVTGVSTHLRSTADRRSCSVTSTSAPSASIRGTWQS